MTWSLPDTYHSAGHGRGTATFKFYEGRDILDEFPALFIRIKCTSTSVQVGRFRRCAAEATADN
jgi:hypothetical protein